MTYEFDGKKYEQASAHQKQWGSRLVQELELKGSERILDLGCGDGELTAQLAGRVPGGTVLGIDASAGMIEAAQKHAAENLRFERRDINALDWDHEFDVVFSNAALHWIKDHGPLLDGVFRALRRGGAARFNFAGDGNCAHFFKVVREAMALPAYRRYFDDFDWPWFMPSVKQYEDLMHRSEFSDFRVWGENADHFFADIDGMIGWVDQPSLVPFIACVGEDDKQAFRRYVIDRMIEETRGADGRCFETFRRINVLARKG